MPALSLYLFGRFCVRCDDRVLDSFDACKAQELFCYLLLHRNSSHSREALAALLWGDSSTAQSKKYLRQALWQLQTTLESRMGPPLDRVVLVETDRVRLNPVLDLWLDVGVFEQVFALTQETPGRELDTQRAGALREAVQLYRGDLLEGCYQDWCLYERERLQNMYLAMSDKLVRYCEAQEDFDAGLYYAAQVLRYDPARERTHRQMMRLYALSGDRTAALRQYERCTTALNAELGVRPTRRTVELHGLIQADQLSPAEERAGPSTLTPETANALLPEVLKHLKEVRATLSAIQRQVRKDIQTVEMALGNRADKTFP